MTLKAPLTACVLSGSNFVCQVGDIRCSQFCCVISLAKHCFDVCRGEWPHGWFGPTHKGVQCRAHRGGDGRELSADRLRQLAQRSTGERCQQTLFWLLLSANSVLVSQKEKKDSLAIFVIVSTPTIIPTRSLPLLSPLLRVQEEAEWAFTSKTVCVLRDIEGIFDLCIWKKKEGISSAFGNEKNDGSAFESSGSSFLLIWQAFHSLDGFN